MLKIKFNNLVIRDTKVEDYLAEYEINKVGDRLIFPVYISNNYVEAIELIKEDNDDYYILIPCLINKSEGMDISDTEKIEDFKDAIEAINTFFEFNIENIV